MDFFFATVIFWTTIFQTVIFETVFLQQSYFQWLYCNSDIWNGHISNGYIFHLVIYIYACPPSWFPHQIILPSPTEMSSLSRLDSSSSSDDDDELILSALHIAHTQCPVLISTCLMPFLFMLQDIPTMQQSEWFLFLVFEHVTSLQYLHKCYMC